MTAQSPENYWINRGADVVGMEGVTEGENTNQAPVYRRLAQTIVLSNVNHVVDIGCNVGQLALFLRRQGYRGSYQGIDSNPHAIEVARKNLEGVEGYSFEEGNLRWLDIRSYSQMMVVTKDVIEHLEDDTLFSKLLDISRRYVLIASFLPWIDSESIIEQTADGYYMNHYNRARMLDLAAEHHFALAEMVTVASADGWQNQVVLFERQPKNELESTPAEEAFVEDVRPGPDEAKTLSVSAKKKPVAKSK